VKTIQPVVKALLILAASVALAYASDPIAVYARVDKVVLEPNTDSPEAIQVWGVFSMAKPDERNDYLPPARGYLYFKLGDDPSNARKEWSDLKQMAGGGQLVSFGSRHKLKARLRKPGERPESPDPYVANFGMAKVRDRTDYAPVRALLDYKD
jgi:hypothetical protein